MAVVAQVASRSTSRSGLRSGCRARQARRAAATSGRACSAACWVFLSRQARGDQEPAKGRAAHRNARGRQPATQLADREVRLGRQQRLHPLGVPRQLGTALARISHRQDS
jgi:hypothetical protein